MKNALHTFVVGCLLLFSRSAVAEHWSPNRPIQIIVPYAAGGAIDITFRTIAPYLSQRLGQSVVVVDKPGGSGTIGMSQVAMAAPDGYTLGAASLAFAAAPAVLKEMPYDTLKDFTPITQVARAASVLLINPQSSAKTVQEFIDLVKANPGQLNFTSGGVGSAGDLMAELFLARAGGLNMIHVPFTTHGMAPLVQGLVHLDIVAIPSAMPWMKDGQLRAIAVTSLERDPSVPDLPTVSQTLPGFDTFEWPGLVGPAGMPREIVDRIQQEVRLAVNDPEVKAHLATLGEQPVANTPEEFGPFIQEQMKTWADIGSHLSTMRKANEADLAPDTQH